MQKVSHLGFWRKGRSIAFISSTEYVTILFGVEEGGLGDDCLALWDLYYVKKNWHLLYLYYGLMVFVSSL